MLTAWTAYAITTLASRISMRLSPLPSSPPAARLEDPVKTTGLPRFEIADNELVVHVNATATRPFRFEWFRQVLGEGCWTEWNRAAAGELNHESLRLGLAGHIGHAHHQHLFRIERIQSRVGRPGLRAAEGDGVKHGFFCAFNSLRHRIHRQSRLLVRRETEAVGTGVRQCFFEPLFRDRFAGKAGRLRERGVEHLGIESRDIRIAEQQYIVVLNVEPAEREIGRAGGDRKRLRSIAALAPRDDDLVVLKSGKMMSRDVGDTG